MINKKGFTPTLENDIAKSGRRPMPFFSVGFTILETIVAISIISLVIAGVFSALRTGLSASINSKDEIRAFYLAQEAIEVLKQKRDSNKLISINTDPNQGWLDGIADPGNPCTPGNTCKVDATNMTLENCGGGGCGYLKQSPTNFTYGYDENNEGWPETKYTREIQISNNGADEIEVFISVQWSRGSQNYEFKVKTLLLNWR